MKIVVAMDSFKGSLSAVQACDIVAAALRAVRPAAEAVIRPMADGGEGTGAALMAAANGEWIAHTVTGPLAEMRVEAGFVWLPKTHAAVVEMATASGLQLLKRRQQNPLLTTTYGTGELIAAAIDFGAERVLLAVGGSATVDGGAGAAMALGWRFLTKEGQDIALGGGPLAEIHTIIPPESAMRADVQVLCDVDNPLCGPHGAARVYGPQKGAAPEMVETLEAGLSHVAELVKRQLGRDVKDLPGAGAAGGLAAGAVAFMNAHLVSGIDTVMSHSGLREVLARADWVITGEGCFDEQSLRGKVVSGVTRIARKTDTKVAVLAGRVLLSPEQYRAAGIEAAVPCMDGKMELEHAIVDAAVLLDRAARRFACAHLCG